jgi:hypothetical protein
MRITIIAASVLLLLSACRGEKPPRDYQNEPPAMTHPPTSSAQTPSANGMRGPGPEPSKGAEGRNITREPASATAAPGTIGNQAPVTATHT